MLAVPWVEEMLDQNGVSYQECHHPEAFTAQQMAQFEHMSGHRVAKVVIAMVDGRPVELVLPASRRVMLKRVQEILGADEVRLATEEEIAEHFADARPGAIPALRHWRNVELLMDESLRVPGYILVPAGTREEAIRIKFDDWFDLVDPWVDRFSEPIGGKRFMFMDQDEPWIEGMGD